MGFHPVTRSVQSTEMPIIIAHEGVRNYIEIHVGLINVWGEQNNKLFSSFKDG